MMSCSNLVIHDDKVRQYNPQNNTTLIIKPKRYKIKISKNYQYI